jgi:hypothetical protein
VRPGFTTLSGALSVVHFPAGADAADIALRAGGRSATAVHSQTAAGRLLLAVLFAIPAGFESYGNSPVSVFLSCWLIGAASLVWMWLLRRFGFLTNVIVWLVQGIALAAGDHH